MAGNPREVGISRGKKEVKQEGGSWLGCSSVDTGKERG